MTDEELRGSELTAYGTEPDYGIVREPVWSVKIHPDENEVEIHFADDREEPEVKELDEFLENFNRKIEIINYDKLHEITEGDDGK